MILRRALCLLAACAGALAAPAAAQSVYGCTDLAGQNAFASVEGADGTFYRIDPDLMMTHPFSDDTVAGLAELSRRLAARGTRLIYVPLPTKSLAMPEGLPPEAHDLGYDATLAATLYDDMLRRLAEAGVTAVNARAALRGGAGAAPSFFATDPRLTATGARRTAEAIAATLATLPGTADLPRARFETRPAGVQRLPSAMRLALQRHCLIPLPEVETETFVTTRLDGAAAGGGNALLGGGPRPQARVALVGTEYSGDPALNLAGFLSTATGLDVQGYAVAGGGAFAAISSYLTSRAFAEGPPAVLVWTNPVFESLASHGDQPLRELIAAAGDSCRTALPAGPGPAPEHLIADLSALDPAQPAMLMIDTGGSAATAVTVELRGPGTPARSRSVHRHRGQVPTGLFYLPLDGLWPEGAATGTATVADIRLALPFGPAARVTACADTPAGAPPR
jgi:alginate biosynthesis protein AlgX